MIISVPVKFEGTVEVEVPTNIPLFRVKALAKSVALAKILATTDNPDAPEDAACEEYADKYNLIEAVAEMNWDGCKVLSVSGCWE